MRRRQFAQLSAYFLGGVVASCSRSSGTLLSNPETAQGPLQIWWQEGFYPEEIDALTRIIRRWEIESDKPVDLTVIPQKDIIPSVERALVAGELPDIFYSGAADLTIIPRLAWNDQLTDVSDVITPLKDRYTDNALTGVNYQNRLANSRSYYAVPLMQSAIHIHYWEDLLVNKIGERRVTIPKNWQDFWQFWQDTQAELQGDGSAGDGVDGGTGIYGVGMPMSLSLDTYNNFEQFLEAYNVRILDEAGNLNVAQPETRQALLAALTDYTRFYKNGAVPPDAVDWDNTGNNVSLLSRNSLMTVNHTLSAPGSQRSDEEVYYKKLSTVKWPSRPNGDAMRFVIELKQAVIFKQSSQQQAAKDFLAYLAQPENLATYTKGAQGRYLPVMPELLDDPFWQEARDPHISVALEQLQETRAAYQVFNPAYGEVAAQNVWGQVIRKIAVDNLSLEKATDEAIDLIEGIFSAWAQDSAVGASK
ncbi:MAG: ABC transporter substrate-binding protein [Cyanobacteria bacterium P01_A01_bin.105]